MSDTEKLELAMTYAGHRYNCDAIQPMWHKGPCDCGWEDAKKSIEA